MAVGIGNSRDRRRCGGRGLRSGRVASAPRRLIVQQRMPRAAVYGQHPHTSISCWLEDEDHLRHRVHRSGFHRPALGSSCSFRVSPETAPAGATRFRVGGTVPACDRSCSVGVRAIPVNSPCTGSAHRSEILAKSVEGKAAKRQTPLERIEDGPKPLHLGTLVICCGAGFETPSFGLLDAPDPANYVDLWTTDVRIVASRGGKRYCRATGNLEAPRAYAPGLLRSPGRRSDGLSQRGALRRAKLSRFAHCVAGSLAEQSREPWRPPSDE